MAGKWHLPPVNIAPGMSLFERSRAGRKNLIVVDIDSTLYAFIPMFVRAAKDLLDIDVNPEPRYFHEPFDGLTREQIHASIEYCNRPEFMSQHHLPFERAADVLNDLAARGYDIRYITDRPDMAYDLTHSWLVEHGFPAPDSLLCCNGDKKDAVCALSKHAIAIIDDKPNTMVWAYYEAKIPHVLAIRNSTNWNMQDMDFVHLADTWHELEEELLKRLP